MFFNKQRAIGLLMQRVDELEALTQGHKSRIADLEVRADTNERHIHKVRGQVNGGKRRNPDEPAGELPQNVDQVRSKAELRDYAQRTGQLRARGPGET